jgi:Protein of unknown function (DUF4446)
LLTAAKITTGSDRTDPFPGPVESVRHPEGGITDRMPDASAVVQANLVPILILAAVLVVALLLWNVWLTRRLGGVRRDLKSGDRGVMLRGGDSGLDMARIYELIGQVHRVDDRTSALEGVGRKAVQRVGLVRFNPFEDTGSNQSFALALLDGEEDGVVISSLHSRVSTRIYAKPITQGRSEAALSAEESEALRQARSGIREAVTA